MALPTLRALARTRISPRLNLVCTQWRAFADDAAPSADWTPPPLLAKLRTDLKTAMRSRDQARLSVLKGLIAEVTNAAKSDSPVRTDMQLLTLVKKRTAKSKEAMQKFRDAGREDLMDQEGEQVSVLEEYAGHVETMSSDEIREVVKKVVDDLTTELGSKPKMKLVIERLVHPGGVLFDKPAEKGEIVKMITRVFKKI